MPDTTARVGEAEKLASRPNLGRDPISARTGAPASLQQLRGQRQAGFCNWSVHGPSCRSAQSGVERLPQFFGLLPDLFK